MRIASLHCLAAIAGVLFLLNPVFGQTLTAESPIDLKMRQKDVRLNVPITFSADQVYLGELLEMLSAKTHVTLSMDNTDRFSGIRIACDLKKVPLADVMNSLWSLVGSNTGVWEWRADTRQSPIRYSFRPTLKARNLADRLNAALQEAFEAKTETMIRLAFLSAEARKADGGKLLAALEPEDTERVRNNIARLLDTEDIWSGMRLFATLLSSGERYQVLHGGSVAIPLTSLSQEDRQSADRLVGEADANEPPRTLLRFAPPLEPSTYRRRGIEVQISGSNEQGGVSSHTNFGIGTKVLFPRIAAEWILQGDLPARDIDRRPLKTLTAFQPDEIWLKAPIPDRNIAQVAATEGVSFMAVVPAAVGTVENADQADQIEFTLLGKTPLQFFNDDFWKWLTLHKWRSGILLLHYPDWFCGDQGEYPFETVKRLRASVKQQEGLLTLDDVADPLTTLSQKQLAQITVEFPFPGGQLVTMGENPSSMTLISTFYKRYPQCLSERGIALDLKMQVLLKELKLWPTVLEEKERVTAVRITRTLLQGDAPGTHRYSLQLHASQHGWMFEGSIEIARIAPKP